MADISRLEALLPRSIIKDTPMPAPANTSVPSVGQENFSDLLKNAMNSVNDAQLEATEAVKQLQSGESSDIANTMIAVEKARVSLDMMLEVRNTILEAYQEVIRTQI